MTQSNNVSIQSLNKWAAGWAERESEHSFFQWHSWGKDFAHCSKVKSQTKTSMDSYIQGQEVHPGHVSNHTLFSLGAELNILEAFC